MGYNLIIKEAAYVDALKAYLYYEEQKEGLGERFLLELSNRYKHIRENPQHYSFISADIEKTMRKVKIKSFPYIVIYDYAETEVIVYAVYNCHKNRIE